MRNWIKLIEEKHYAGSCINSFDSDGDCVVDDLPWSTVSDLGYADENATDIGEYSFKLDAKVPQEIIDKISQHKVQYLVYDNVYMLYDVDDDIHYFFV